MSVLEVKALPPRPEKIRAGQFWQAANRTSLSLFRVMTVSEGYAMGTDLPITFLLVGTDYELPLPVLDKLKTLVNPVPPRSSNWKLR